MKKKWTSLCLALAMAASLACPVGAAELDTTADDQVMVFSDLAELDSSIEIPHEGSKETALTMQEAAAFVLRQSGMSDAQLGAYPDDYNAMAISVGLVSEDFDPQAPCTQEQLEEMQQIAQPLKEAMSKEKKEPLFMNGMAQPIFEYTSGMASDDEYSNAASEITRYCVYVETNYDTDGDGKLDLVKALVQIPDDAVGSDHKFATIFEARPYITGCSDNGEARGFDYKDDSLSYNLDNLYAQPEARTPAGTATTWEAALDAKASEWYYLSPYESNWGPFYDYEDLDWYDYFLVRGYAVVEVAGLGTRGSEGFETCGTDLEIDAFKCVIEWLTGDRVAYTDKTSNIAIEAEWSNGSVGMTGRSYGGTTQFGLATTGVEGLKTIVPVAGIASYYDYTNSQGISTLMDPAYSDWLALYCAGRYIDEEDWNSIADNYASYLSQIWQDQLALNGDYGDHWAVRDYTPNAEKIQCPALIVHGLNDDNVRTKQFDMMYQAFQEAGQEVKLVLHQDAHVTPAYDSHKTEFYIDGQSYNGLLNQWFSHYLYNVDNGIENMAEVTVQNNTDGSWDTYDQWPADGSFTLSCEDESDTVTLSSDYQAISVNESNWESTFVNGSSASNVVYSYTVPEDTTIQGTVEVHVKASTTLPTSGKDDALMMSAMLVDVADEPFGAFMVDDSSYVTSTTLEEGGAWIGGGVTNYDLIELTQTQVNYKVIARGWMDLANPNAGFDSASAARTDMVELGDGTYYDYTIYLQPNVYTVEEGHHLALVIFPYEPGRVYYGDSDNYSITIDTSASYAEIPTNGTYTVTYSAQEGGSVASETQSGSTVAGNALVTLTAQAESGYHFTGWQVNGKDAGPQNPAQFTITENTDIVACFAKDSSGGSSSGGSSSGSNPVTPPEENTPDFADVAEDDWFAQAVSFVASEGLMQGTGEDSFSPNATTTRGMIVTILYQLEGKPAVSGASFSDVSSGDYYADAVAWAAQLGLVSGYGNGQFGPNDAITREQTAAILYAYAQYKGWVKDQADTTLEGFQDQAQVSDYAVEALAWAVDAGLISGTSQDTLSPAGTATRAQAAVMLMHFCQDVAQ